MNSLISHGPQIPAVSAVTERGQMSIGWLDYGPRVQVCMPGDP